MKRAEEPRADRKAPLTVRMDLSPGVIISAVQRMKKSERDEFLEDLLAAASPDFLASICEARAQYDSGKTRSLEELFGR
jgi:hypothetical protein